MRKIAEGEILVHTQKSGQNVDQLRQYLASLRAESQRTSVGLDQLAKSIFMANARGASLGRTIKGLASAAGFGGFGAAAYLAVDKMTRGIVNAQEESDKLAETLNKAIGAKAADSIEGTTQKMQSLTSAINETRGAIGKQGVMNSIAAFFFNDDADKAAKAFERAVEARISLGDKLTQQEAQRIAQQKILMGLDGDMAEIFKINIETRKKLTQIEANDALTAQQKIDQAKLAGEEKADKLRALRTKKEKEEAKKSFEETKKLDEDIARTSLKLNDSLLKQEEERFKKNAEAFKKSQEERAKAAEEANKRIADSAKKAAEQIQKQDDEAKKKFEEAKGVDEAILGASRPGQQALNVARKQRARQVFREDFRTQDAFLQAEADRLSRVEGVRITKQDLRKRIASRVAAGETPTLGERLQGTAAGIEPAQVARSRAESTMASQNKEIPDLMRSIEKILVQLSSAPLVTSGGK
jgi:tetratricopeptide (TPR) repeat protein